MKPMNVVALLAGFSVALVATSSFAQESAADPTEAMVNQPVPAPTPERTAAVVSSSPAIAEGSTVESGTPRYDLVRINAGFKIGYVTSRGFDPFASNDVLAQFSLDGTYPILTRGRLVLAAGLGWDVGGRSDGLRGLSSSLSAHRFYVPIEGRWNMSSWIYGFAKVSPGAAAVFADIEDPFSGQTLSGTGWAFSADASVGASVLLGAKPRASEKRSVRFAITPEVGWSVATRAPLSLNRDRDEAELLGTDENQRLRSVALGGFFWRASAGIVF